MNQVITFTLFLFLLHSFPQAAAELTGKIQGQVIDQETLTPLPGVNVFIEKSMWGAATDTNGQYSIAQVPVGSYQVIFSFIGYRRVVITDVIVKSNRLTMVNAELPPEVLELEGVSIVGGYFTETEDAPLSATSLRYEEIRRSPGAHGDVSRIVAVLPSVAPSTDQTNNLVVRGGNPGENGFYVDNIQILNINHFPTQGSAGGALGILNVEFIDDFSFYSGGFSAAFADRLSSVMDISFRQGNREHLVGQVDLNWAGFGVMGEGPLANGRGSWLAGLRRSYLDLLVKYIDVGNTIAPRYSDAQAKVVFDINPDHQLTLLEIGAVDENHADRQTAIDNKMIAYMNQNLLQNTVGLNWRALWNKNGFSNTSLACTRDQYHEDVFDTGSNRMLLQRRSQNHIFSFRNINQLKLNHSNTLAFGFESKFYKADLNNTFKEQWDASGTPLPSLTVDRELDMEMYGGFINHTWRPYSRLTAEAGMRIDYSSLQKNGYFSPRIMLNFELTSKTMLSAAVGRYVQNLPLELVAQNPSFNTLSSLQSDHYIVGLSHMLNEHTRLTLELYKKQYSHFPMDKQQPAFFIIDEPFYNNGFYRPYETLVDNGKALSRGIELMVQNKLTKNVYGLMSGCLYRAEYTGLDGMKYRRTFDQRVLFSAEGGYKPNNLWEVSLHWTLSGGRPYTPFDIQMSEEMNSGIIDSKRVNGERYPAFNWLNIRVDRRVHFLNSNLVMYLSIYNVLNRKNVSALFWNPESNRQEVINQWGMLPIFGIEYDF